MKTQEEIEQLAELYTQDGIYLSESEKQQTEIAYMTGYTQCQEDMADKKYTEEDIKKAIFLSSISNTDFIPDRCDEIINSLNKQDL
jgi:hypothetical protein